jgi:putative ABC transport system permease protein
MLSDLQFAIRLLIKQPAFTLITVLVLAIGTGATTAIFSVVDAVLLRPLPYRDAGRLVQVSNLWRKTGLRGTVSAPDFHDWHDQATVFDGLAAYLRAPASVTVDGLADYAVVTRATPEFLPLMTAHAELGRLPDEEEQRTGGPLAVVVSHAFWMSHLGGDREALGRTVTYASRLFTVVGVLSPEFRFPAGTDIWSPWWAIPETRSRSAHNYRTVGRLKPGVTLAHAQGELDAIAARLESAYPKTNDAKGVAVDVLLDELVRNVRSTLNLIFGVVVVVLLIACVNVSNLLLVRGTSRSGELAIRAAIGASRGRVIRQLVTESALLALVAGAAGVLVAGWGIRGLVAIAPAGLPRLNEVTLDGRVLLFASVISLTTSLLFGLAPAFQASRLDLNEILKQGGRGSNSGGGRLRASLIVFETAAAVVLVIGAGLLVRSFSALSHVDMGFRPDHLLVADTAVPSGDLETARRAVLFYRDLMPRLAAVPGVTSAAAVLGIPTQVQSNGGYAIEGGPTFEQMGVRSPQALFTVVTPHYFKTVDISIRRGRDFGEIDGDGAPLVAIVNDALARRSFPGQDPIGHRIATGMDGLGFMTIVGVVADVRSADPARVPPAQVYMPFEQHPLYATALTIVLRTSGDPMQAVQPVVQHVRALRPDVPVKAATMNEALGLAVAAPRFRTILLALFAGVALVLAMAGIYGVVSFTVSQRTSELGLRMALGAQRSEIVRLTVSAGLRLTAIGVAGGCAVAVAMSRVVSSMLFETPARDPVVFALVAALLLVAAALASMAPALRAARIDPMVALRVE